MKVSLLASGYIRITILLIVVGVLPLAGIQAAFAQRESGAVSGSVTSGLGTQDPLGGVTVTLATAANEVDTIAAPYAADAVRRFEVVTDADGNYSFENIPPGDYVIFAAGEDLADLPAITLVLQAGEAQTIDFAMTPGGSIIGQVSSANDLSIFGGAVTLFNRQLAVQTALIRSDGTYLFPNVVPGNEYQLFVQTATEAILSASNLSVNEGTALELDLEVDTASRLTGRIVSDTGAPVEKAIVSLESPVLRWSGLTNAAGFYDLTGAGNEYGTLIPGTYDIRIRADRFAGIFEEAVDLSQPTAHVEDFTLDRAGVVTGQVVGDDGVPVSDATISAVGAAGPEYATLTQDDGTYSLDLLDADQAYTLIAFSTGYAPITLTEVTVGKGEVLSGIDFILPVGTYIEGVATSSSGDVSGAIIDFYSADGSVNMALTDADGVFSFDGFAPGDYVVVANTALQDVGFAGTVTIGDGTTQVAIDLQATGSLTGTAQNAAIVVVTFEGVVLTVQPVGEDGSYEVFGLAPGAYEVTARSEAGASEATAVEIEAGGEATLDLTVE